MGLMARNLDVDAQALSHRSGLGADRGERSQRLAFSQLGEHRGAQSLTGRMNLTFLKGLVFLIGRFTLFARKTLVDCVTLDEDSVALDATETSVAGRETLTGWGALAGRVASVGWGAFTG